MHFLAVIDFTELGTFSQQNINAHSQWLANVLGKNPLSHLSIVSFAAVCCVSIAFFQLGWSPNKGLPTSQKPCKKGSGKHGSGLCLLYAEF
jgi:hypothetical protein